MTLADNALISVKQWNAKLRELRVAKQRIVALDGQLKELAELRAGGNAMTKPDHKAAADKANMLSDPLYPCDERTRNLAACYLELRALAKAHLDSPEHLGKARALRSALEEE